MMNHYAIRILFVCQLVLTTFFVSPLALAASEPAVQDAEPEKGPHRGRILRDGEFALELAIFEIGVPPEFRVWITHEGKPISPTDVKLQVQLTRLGNVVDEIGFKAEGDYLRGDTVIYEPHSFVVTVNATYKNQTHRWQYDNFEGRTRVAEEIAGAMGISTEIAGAQTLQRTIRVYGKLALAPDAKREIQARYEGEVKEIHVALGESVKKGQLLATIESNESLKSYQIFSPMSGVVSQQYTSAGEQTAARALLEITRTDRLLAELAVYPMDMPNVRLQAPVYVMVNGLSAPLSSTIFGARVALRADQARLFLAELNNSDGLLSEGLFISADIEVETITVPLAVKRSGLQGFRDFTVVYVKVGEEYEVRMLELGREAGPLVEVLGGLEPGTVYVTENSYIIKADIEKSGASHDH